MPLAHPLTEPREVVAPPALLAIAVLALVVLAGLVATRRRARRSASVRAGALEAHDPVLDPLLAPLSLTWLGVVGRAVGLLLLAIAVAAGLAGSDDQLENIAPALLVGFGWPALVVGEAVVGGVWARINPFDTLGRLVAPLGAGDGRPADDVRPSAVVALLWTWYLTVPANALAPQVVGAVFGAYVLLTVAGILASGRVAWLTGVELFTVLFGWITRARRGQLAGWVPPTGARAVLAILAGGLLTGQVRDTHLADPLRTATWSWLWHSVLLVGLALTVWLVLHAAARASQTEVAVAAVVWVVVGLAVALALARSRVLTSVQLLPALASDPGGVGWDLFGTAGPTRIVARPLSEAGQVLAQVGILAAGGMAGAVAVGRATWDASSQQRHRAGVGVGLLTWLAVMAYASI